MIFTRKNTLNDIVNDERIGKIVRILVATFVLDAIPEEKMDLPLEDLARELPGLYGMPSPAVSILDAAEKAEELADKGFTCISLWKEDAPEGFIPDIRENSKESVFLATISEKKPGEKKPVMIVVPGGGYHFVAHRGEGITTAEYLEKNGYKTFILNYRMGENRWPAPQLDLALAIKYVKLHAEEYGIDPENLTIIGSSAGGHLCGSFAALHESLEETLSRELSEKHPALYEQYAEIHGILPDRVCLVYPVITFTEGETHQGSYENLTGRNEALRAALSIENLVTPAYPKTFVWCCADDPLVPMINTEKMDAALTKAGVPHLMRIYPTGGHGINLGIGTSAEGWADEMIAFFRE